MKENIKKKERREMEMCPERKSRAKRSRVRRNKSRGVHLKASIDSRGSINIVYCPFLGVAEHCTRVE